MLVAPLALGAMAGCVEDGAEEAEDTVPQQPTSSLAPTTTAIPAKTSVEDLPVADDPSASQDAILVMQQLLNSSCCELVADGIWGLKTQDAISSFRNDLGLPVGGLDHELWQTVFTLKTDTTINLATAKSWDLPIPVKAIQIPNPSDDTLVAFTIAQFSEVKDVVGAYQDFDDGQLPQWRYCSTSYPNNAEILWWNPASDLSQNGRAIVVSQVGPGRVDIVLKEKRLSAVNCKGYYQLPRRPVSPTTTGPPGTNYCDRGSWSGGFRQCNNPSPGVGQGENAFGYACIRDGDRGRCFRYEFIYGASCRNSVSATFQWINSLKQAMGAPYREFSSGPVTANVRFTIETYLPYWEQGYFSSGGRPVPPVEIRIRDFICE